MACIYREIVLDFEPREHFKGYHMRGQRWSCMVAHRRSGKTVASVFDTVFKCLQNPLENPQYAYIAPTYKQAKVIAWPYLEGFAKQFGDRAKINQAELKVTLPNGGWVGLFGSENPDALRGIYLDGAVFDEYAHIDQRLFPEIIRPALSDRKGWAGFMGTPAGIDAFYRIWRESQKAPGKWFSKMLKASESDILDSEELEDARTSMAPSQFAREFECSFEEPDISQFISKAVVDLAFARDPEERAFGPKLLGVDIARYGDDRTCFVLRNGDYLSDIKRFQGLDLMQVAGEVAQYIDRVRPDATFVDATGMGSGVVDRLRQLGYPVFEVHGATKALDQNKYTNRRTEMWDLMRLWIMDRAALPRDQELMDDLTGLNYKFDHSNRLALESKKDLKGRGLPSPDVGDALSLTFYQKVAPKEMRLMDRYVSTVPEESPFADL